MKVLKVMGAAAILTLSAAATEMTHFYVGAGLGFENASSHLYDESGQIAGMLEAGYDLTKHISLELRTATMLQSGDKLDHPYSYGGLFVKYRYQWKSKPEWQTYLFGGYSKNKITFPNEYNYNGVKNSETIQSGFAYGIGVSKKINDRYSFFLDYTHWIDDEVTIQNDIYGIKVNSFYFGVQYHIPKSNKVKNSILQSFLNYVEEQN